MQPEETERGGEIRPPVKLADGWRSRLDGEFEQPYMRELSAFLRARRAAGAVIYPPGKQMFRALDLTPPDRVRVVILGQDPYHGPGQAEGLCFSVRVGQRWPPSLRNIFQELARDLGVMLPQSGSLLGWAKQGVLLLNTVLTVEQGSAGAHQGKGWERFTDAVIDIVNRECQHVVFMLWGSHAQRKCANIDAGKHLLLCAPHPSPLSAHRGFIGCGHFSQANAYLMAHGYEPVDWLAKATDIGSSG